MVFISFVRSCCNVLSRVPRCSRESKPCGDCWGLPLFRLVSVDNRGNLTPREMLCGLDARRVRSKPAVNGWSQSPDLVWFRCMLRG